MSYFIFFKLFFLSTIIYRYFVFSWFICSLNFLAIFPFLQNVSYSYFIFSKYKYKYKYKCNVICIANIFSYSLPIFILLGTIFILCITFCNAKLNSIGYKGSPWFRPVLFSKKDDNVPSVLTTLLVFCTHLLHIHILI